MNPFVTLMQRLNEAKEAEKDQDIRIALAAAPASNTPDQHASTFIKHIRYVPNRTTAFVTIGNNTYYYPMNDYQMAAWLRSKSLGKWYNDNIKLKTNIRIK
jgi:hypothetical protein